MFRSTLVSGDSGERYAYKSGRLGINCRLIVLARSKSMSVSCNLYLVSCVVEVVRWSLSELLNVRRGTLVSLRHPVSLASSALLSEPD